MLLLLGRKGAPVCGQVALFRSTVTLFGESIALVGCDQEGIEGDLPSVEDPFAGGRDVVPKIGGATPCVGAPLAIVKPTLAVLGGDIPAVVVRRQRIHHCLQGLGEVES